MSEPADHPDFGNPTDWEPRSRAARGETVIAAWEHFRGLMRNVLPGDESALVFAREAFIAGHAARVGSDVSAEAQVQSLTAELAVARMERDWLLGAWAAVSGIPQAQAEAEFLSSTAKWRETALVRAALPVPVERRVRERRSEANTPRSEMEPNRRKLPDRRAPVPVEGEADPDERGREARDEEYARLAWMAAREVDRQEFTEDGFKQWWAGYTLRGETITAALRDLMDPSAACPVPEEGR